MIRNLLLCLHWPFYDSSIEHRIVLVCKKRIDYIPKDLPGLVTINYPAAMYNTCAKRGNP